jgi:signal transduction histidine kinase
MLGWIESHPLATDAVLAVALSGAALVSSYVEFENAHPGGQSYQLPSNLAGVVAMVGPLVLRRRFPLSVLVACTCGFLLSRIVLDAGDASITTIVLSLAFYSAAAHGRERWRSWACGVCLVAVMAELWREAGIVFPPSTRFLLLAQVFALLINFVLYCAMWALGAALGSGRRRAKELLERTAELERERGENARRAVFDERVRIARELHDVVAHHVSMMGVQAGAARVVIGRDPVRAKQALASIERSSRQAVLELHRLLGFLRQAGDPDALAPQPGLGQLPGLAATMSGADLTVEVRVEGDERPLPATVDVSAYRIVQEALTNTLKHSGGSRACVQLRYRPDELEVEIIDDGPGQVASSSPSGGLGLIGMRERASLHGGQLSAGRVAGGGFSVCVKLPTPDGAL